MGYYTNFKLDYTTPQNYDNALLEEAIYQHNHTEYGEPIGNVLEESCKWYGYEEDMVKFSKLFPEVLFKLSGEGEEVGDAWRLFVKNGKSKLIKAKLVFEPFDEKDLE